MAKKSFADRFYAPRNILINVAQLLIVLPVSFLFALLAVRGEAEGIVGLSSLMIGIVLGTSMVLIGPPNVFEGGMLGGRQKPMEEIEEPARRILSFFKSRKARKIIYRTAGYLAILLLIGWYVVMTYVPYRYPRDPTQWVGDVGAVFFTMLSTFCTELGILALYVLCRWDKIQKEYEPWPIDTPYIDLSTYTSPQGRPKK